MKKHASKLLPFALAAVLAPAGVAHAGGGGTVEGSVINDSGTPLGAGVRIQITCGTVKKTASVSAGGQFRISDLPEGTCTLTGTAMGYAPFTVVVNVAAGSISTVLVGMSPPRKPEERDLAVPVAAAEPARAPMPAPKDLEAAERPVPPARRPPGAGAVAKPQAVPGAPAPIVKADPVMGRARVARLEQAKDKRDLGEDNAWNGQGWAPVRVFPVPQYTKAYDGPRTDFRETVYWNPVVETDATGHAEVSFVLSDAVTAFRATAEGFAATGTPGTGQLAVTSKLPLTLDAHLPVEVTAGDTILLPVTLANETAEPIDARLDAQFGSAFKLATNPAGPMKLAAGEKRSVFFPLEVVATSGTADVLLAARGRGLSDELKKTIRIVPKGFPFELSASGTATRGKLARHELDLAGALPGSIEASVTMYASPVASMTKGLEGMIREPGGCFEQTSATNYPNIMILSYLQTHDAAEPALVEQAQSKLDKGYKLLTGYETKQRGYEWFGSTPGHEALTAYGLMEFADMAGIYDVDQAMVQRTADWLMSRRDGKGGFLRSTTALDSFGRASEPTTNAYIMWALAEAKRAGGMTKELDAQRALARSTDDPYLLALATNTLLLASPDDGKAAVRRLAAMQGKDGSFPGAKESITRSGGESLAIETTALATLALLKSGEHAGQVRGAVDWLNSKRGGYGEWSNTQATILGLKALTAYAQASRQMAAGGQATLIVNGKRLQTIEFEAGRKEALVWNDVATALLPGKNTVEIELASDAQLPYSIAIGYRSARPQSSPAAKVKVATELGKGRAKMGEGVPLRVHVENATSEGLPMTLARVGIPGGMVFQTWQLKELREKGKIDFYETRPREVILYWRGMAPSAKVDLDLQLLAKTPGSYEAPASSAYLYYTDEDRTWSSPTTITIAR